MHGPHPSTRWAQLLAFVLVAGHHLHYWQDTRLYLWQDTRLCMIMWGDAWASSKHQVSSWAGQLAALHALYVLSKIMWLGAWASCTDIC
jgi:hypothetical protein